MQAKMIWFEIPVADMERAQEFYEGLFGVTLERCEGGSEAMCFFPGNVGALSSSEGFHPARDGVLAYFDAASALETLVARVDQLGGEIVRPITPIRDGAKGAFALVADSEGNRIGLYAPSPIC